MQPIFMMFEKKKEKINDPSAISSYSFGPNKFINIAVYRFGNGQTIPSVCARKEKKFSNNRDVGKLPRGENSS